MFIGESINEGKNFSRTCQRVGPYMLEDTMAFSPVLFDVSPPLAIISSVAAIGPFVSICKKIYVDILLVLLLGSRGPSTVTLIAFWYRAICGGWVYTAIVIVKLLPEKY